MGSRVYHCHTLTYFELLIVSEGGPPLDVKFEILFGLRSVGRPSFGQRS